jgi:adenylate cyclase
MTRLHDLVGLKPARGLELPAWLERLVSLGIVTTDPNVARRQRIINVASYIGAMASASRFVANMFHDFNGFAAIQAMFALFVMWALLLHRLHRLHEHAAAVGLMVWFVAGVTCVLIAFGTASQAYIYFGLAGVFILVFGIENWWLVLGWIIVLVGAIFVALRYIPEHGLAAADAQFLSFLSVQTLVNSIVANAVVIFYALLLLDRTEKELQRQSARADALVTAVLPDTIAQRLRAAPEKPIADRIEGLSILFADLVGFTPAAHKEAPETVVAYLDNLVKTFDVLCDAHGLDKIKTIGDSYMAVGGLRGNPREGAIACGRFALAIMQMRVARLGSDSLALRIGIHCGTVIAGVIGETRIAYDMWGDAINVAARMESHGVAGRIHVTEDYRKVVEGIFAFEARGATELKGIGFLPTYFLLGPRAPG